MADAHTLADTPPNTLDPQGSPPAPDPRRWGLGEVWIGFGAGLLLSTLGVIAGVVLALLLGTASLGGGDPDAVMSLATEPVVILGALVGLWLGFGGAPILASYVRGQKSLKKDFGLSFVWKRDLPLGIVLGLALRGLEALVLYLLDLVGYTLDLGADNTDFLSSQVGNWGIYLLLGLAAGIGAPFFEELFFRGLYLQALMKRHTTRRGRQLSALLITSLVFGCLHWNLEPSGTILILFTGSIGFLLGVLTLRYGRLGPAIITHAAFNTSAVALLALGF